MIRQYSIESTKLVQGLEASYESISDKKAHKAISRYINIVLVLACFSYPITTTVLLFLELPLDISNIILKFIYATIYVSLVYKAYRINSKFAANAIPLFVFFFLYGLRLIYDIEINDVRMIGYSPIYIYLYYFILTVLPCFALTLASDFIDVTQLYAHILWSLVLANILLLILTATSGYGDLQAALNSRIQVDGDREDTTVINPLMVGMMGTSLSSLGLSRLCLLPSKTRKETLFFLISIFLGIINVLFSASRGPFLALLVSIFLIVIVALIPTRNLNIPKFSTVATYLTMLSAVVMAVFLNTETFLFDRLLSFFGDQNSRTSEARSYSFDSAFQDFSDAPFFGNQFVGTLDSFYPHNIPLEVLMATGVFGGVFFFIALFNLIFSIIRICIYRRATEGVVLLNVAIVHLLTGLTSGSIVSSPEFWIFFTIVLILGKKTLPKN